MQYVTAAEAAKVLGVHLYTVQRNCKAGRIPAKKVGRVWRIPVSWLKGEANA